MAGGKACGCKKQGGIINMNWVSPIKDDETLERFKKALRKVDDKYYILFEIGVGTGLQLQEILKF